MAGRAKKTATTEGKKKAKGGRGSQSAVVSKLLAKVEEKLDGDVKASLGDYIRLIQLQKELEEDEVREIKVTWVQPEPDEPNTAE